MQHSRQLKLIHRLFIKHMLQLLHKVTLSHSGSEKRRSFCRRKKCFVNQPALPAWADKNFKGSIKAAAKYQRAWNQKHKICSGCFCFQPAIHNGHVSAKKLELKVWNIKDIYFKLYVAEPLNFLMLKILKMHLINLWYDLKTVALVRAPLVHLAMFDKSDISHPSSIID